jgi:hypothetical protein
VGEKRSTTTGVRTAHSALRTAQCSVQRCPVRRRRKAMCVHALWAQHKHEARVHSDGLPREVVLPRCEVPVGVQGALHARRTSAYWPR